MKGKGHPRREVGMNKLTVLSEIHGLISYILELPDAAFSNPKQRAEIVNKLIHYYKAVATDAPQPEIAAAYDAARKAMTDVITDTAVRTRVEGAIDNINGDIQIT